MDWFESLISWLEVLWEDFTEFVEYIPIAILDSFLTAIGTVVSSIPVPDFAVGGLQSLFDSFPSNLLYLVGATGLPEALLVVGSGVSFRLVRKLFTLGQW